MPPPRCQSWCEPQRGRVGSYGHNAVVLDRMDGGTDRWRSTGQLIGPRKLDQRRWPQLEGRRHRPPPSRGSESASAFRLSRGRSGWRCFTWIMRCDPPEPPKEQPLRRSRDVRLACSVAPYGRNAFTVVSRALASLHRPPPRLQSPHAVAKIDSATRPAGATSARPPDALITSEEHSGRCCRK